MKKQTFITLLHFLEQVYNDDNEQQEALTNYAKTAFPSSHSPVIEGKLECCLEFVGILDKELQEELAYYFYESKEMEGDCNVEYNGILYSFKNEEDIVKYLQAVNIIEK